MTAFYNHLSWFVFLFCSFVLSVFVSLSISFYGESLAFYFNLFDNPYLDLSVSFSFDYMSSWFFSTVLLISTVIMVYSYNYMSPYSKSIYFLWLTLLFVASMLIVISMNNLFFLMLGWDGLGLISFFLIVYYQNQSSLTSGFFTLLMNRIGDSFFLCTIMLFLFSLSDLSVYSYPPLSLLPLLFLLITFMTKSAIFPFSPWLPAAMAAPTPISALVHSSTLVTSGLFLMMRFSYYLYSSPVIMVAILVCSIFTSFYAGLNTIFEKDLKKLIALSTLSHLGFIGLAFSVGLLNLAFFHMLTHALFKSLLFMTMGDIMINLNHSQDIRYLSKGYSYTPLSSFVMNTSLLNLLGLPSFSGYFSKDLVLEGLNYSFLSFFLYLVVFLNVFFTYYYTYSLLFFSFQSIKLVPYQLIHSPILLHSLLLLSLSLVSVVFGVFFMSHLVSTLCFLVVPTFMKFFPFGLNILFFSFLFLFLRLFTSNNLFLNSYFSQMMFLTPFMMTLSSKFYLKLSYLFVKTFESGLFNFLMNSFPASLVMSFGSFGFRQSAMNPLNLSFFSLFLFFIFMV